MQLYQHIDILFTAYFLTIEFNPGLTEGFILAVLQFSKKIHGLLKV
jgi:hypothetical protein